MNSKELMDKYQVRNVWSCLKVDETIEIGFVPAYLCECINGWLVVILDSSWNEAEVLCLESRSIAMKRVIERGYNSRMRRVYLSE